MKKQGTPQTEEKFRGAIPLMRKFLDHPFWNEKRVYSKAECWIDLLFKARYSEKDIKIYDRGEIITIKYAQILTSVRTLANDWTRSRAFVRHLLSTLQENEAIIVHTMNHRRTILEIVKMGYVKSLLQRIEPQTEPHTLPQKSHRTTHKNKVDKVNKDNNSTTLVKNKINELIKLFEKVNPSYERLFSNKTQRACLERVVDQYGVEKITNLLNNLPSIVQKPYAPRITTPYELEVKMGQLILFLKQEGGKKKGGVTKI